MTKITIVGLLEGQERDDHAGDSYGICDALLMWIPWYSFIVSIMDVLLCAWKFHNKKIEGTYSKTI